MGPHWDASGWMAPGTGMGGAGLGSLWPVVALVVLALLVLGAVSLWRTDGARPDGPEAVLRARYARGEITAEEFDRRSTGLADAAETRPSPTR